MLKWPQNAGNPIFEDLNFKTFPGMDAPSSPQGTAFNAFFSKILYTPQFSVLPPWILEQKIAAKETAFGLSSMG